MAFRSSIGIEDFRRLRESRCTYVDKTHLITELLDWHVGGVVLLPRPRRFGKTLNLSMLKWFFEKGPEDLWHLFEGLHVARAGEAYRAHFQQYPVIHISFKATKAEKFEDCQRAIRSLIQDAFAVHKSSLDGRVDRRRQRDFEAMMDDAADEGLYRRALLNLTEYLHQVHGKRVVVLIDEYDAPIHAGYTYGYYREIIDFFRQFLESGLKDNPHLERAVMTGILRVSKESIFSGLNNATIYSLLRPTFNTCFGFTEEEVVELLEEGGASHLMNEVRAYYNGYQFGGVAIYNPWSILNFLADKSREIRAHWVNSSSNDLVRRLLERHAFRVQDEVQALLEGGSIEKMLEEATVMPELEHDENALWSLLVFSGYLKAVRGPPGLDVEQSYLLSIPNAEVARVYRTTFQSWMDASLQVHGGDIKALLAALLEGNVERFARQLQYFAEFLPSYHDVRGAEPERFHHGLVIGLLAALEPEYEVRSNRESGEGRPDVLIRPRRPGKPGVVLEIKAARDKRGLARALREGLAQLRAQNYAAELRAAGVEKVHSLAIAFDGKRVVVESGDAPNTKVGKLRKIGESVRKVATKVVPTRKTPPAKKKH